MIRTSGFTLLRQRRLRRNDATMLQDFLIPFATIAIVEMGDKTQLAMMAMAARYKHTMQIFLGAMAASAIVDGSAVVLGNYLTRFIPRRPVSMIAGAVFILFGIYSLIKKDEKEKTASPTKRSVFIAAFLLFFVSEFGDKSQFAALLFGTQYSLPLTLLGTLAAIAVLLVIMLAAGKYISKKLDEEKVNVFSAMLFIGIGIWTILRALNG